MAQLDTAPDRPDGTVEMVVGAPPDQAEPGAGGPPETDGTGDGGAHGPSRRWMVLAVAVVVAVAGLGAWLLGRGSARPDVHVRAPFDVSLVDAPSAPARPIAQHWSHDLPTDRELVGIGVVDDTVFVASRDRRRRAERDQVLVQARATTDGSVRWRRTVDGFDTTIVLADDDTTTLLGVTDSEQPFDGQARWEPGAVAVLDPSTGTMHMHRDQRARGMVRVRADGMLEIDDPHDRLELVDPLTGETRLAFDSVRTTNGNETWTRGAWWSGDGWVVPTTAGWDITDRDGDVQFGIDGAEAWPIVFPDLVVHWTDSEVIARRRPSGEVAWRVRVPGWVQWVEWVERLHWTARSGEAASFVVLRLDEPPTPDDEPIPLEDQERLLIEDGALVGPVGDELEPVRSDPWSRLEAEVDGVPIVACRQLPDGWYDESRDVEELCPEELALLGDDDEVLATASPAFSDDHVPSVTWTATDGGILTIEADHVRLYRWGDLSEAWSIPVDAPWIVPPTVATSATGVAVAIPDATNPARVTWYG